MKKRGTNFILTIIGLMLLWLGLLSAQIFFIEKSFTLLTHNYDRDVFYLNNGRDNTNTTKLAAEFTSKDNYLGIVSINFDENQRMHNGSLIFSIKEKGTDSWYYQNTYNAEELNDLSFYPFGFPIINDSKNKHYVVEIELKKENQSNTIIKLGNQSTALATHHQFPKSPLLENNYAFLAFLSKKIVNIVDNNYQIFASIIYLYPLTFYALWRFGNNKLTHVGLLALLILTILFDAIFINEFVDLAYVTIASLWVIFSRKLKGAIDITFKLGFSMLGLGALSQLLYNDSYVEKFASWAFIFILIAVIQSMLEVRKKD